MTLLRDARASLNNPALPLTNNGLLRVLGGTPSAAGVVVNEKTAMGLTSVYRAVALTAGTVAMFPLDAYRLVGEKGARAARLASKDLRTRAENQELYELEARTRWELGRELRSHVPAERVVERVFNPVLADPCGDLDITSFEFWETLVAHLCLWGNSYAFKERNGLGEIKRLVLLNPSRMKVGRAEDRTKVFEYTPDSGLPIPYTTREIFHVPGLGYDGILGLSPIGVARNAVGLGLALEQFGASLFEKGSLAGGVLETDLRLEEDDATALKKRWAERAQGINNAHDVVVLDRGAKFHSMTIPPEDAQFIESRQMQVGEVGRLFGVPEQLMMLSSKGTSWGTGVEVIMRSWITFGLGLWMTRVASRAAKELTPRGQIAEHDTSALLRGDSEAQARYFGMGIRDGWLKRAEPRRWLGLPVDDPALEKYVDPAGAKAPVAGSGEKGSPKAADGDDSEGADDEDE